MLHVITGLNTGGAETMLYKLLAGMDRARFDLMVISLTGRGVMAERIESLGIPVLTCDMRPGRFTLMGFARLLRFIRDFRPHLVQTWLYHADLLGGIAARMSGVRHVVWNIRHSNLDPDKNKAHTLWVVRLNGFLSRLVPERIICNSFNSVLIHRSVGFSADRFAVIPNGFDADLFHPDEEVRRSVRDEVDVTPDAPLVGLVARFDPQKNHRGFVDAAARVHERQPDAYFVLVGAGCEWSNADLAAWIDARSLRERFRLLGRRDDIPRLTAAFDVGVCASWGEGFPNAVGEAMACGVPCVVTDVGDCADIVGDTGWVARSGAMDVLGDRIADALALSADARIALGARARARIIERYSLEAIVRRYEELYRSLVSGAQS